MDAFLEGAGALGVVLTPDQVAQFAQYEALLLQWNARVNLTAVRDAEEIRVRHFLNSLLVSSVTGSLEGQRLVDVGTGAGFPGLPLKILYPTMQLTLVESVAKKAAFLEAVVDALALKDVTTVVERAETVGQDPAHREQYDWAVARAVAELRVLVEYLLPLCRVGGHACAQKGISAPEEVAAALDAVQMLGGKAPELAATAVADGEQGGYLVTIEKVKPTPEKYPRRAGMPAKRPL